MPAAAPKSPPVETAPAADPVPRTGHTLFRRVAEQAASALGSPWASIAALVFVILWALAGPVFHYSDSWELVINTVTSVVTFLMVFLLQNTQMRDSAALHLKLNELLRAVQDARTELVALEHLPDAEIEKLQEQFRTLSDEPAPDPVTPPPTAAP